MRIPPDPQLRAMRKELLLVRAELERAELGGAMGEVRESVSRLGWLRFLAPIVTNLRAAAAGKRPGKRLWRFSWVSSLAALLFTKRSAIKAAHPALRAVSLALAAWQVWRMWQKFRRDDDASPQSSAEAETETVAAAERES